MFGYRETRDVMRIYMRVWEIFEPMFAFMEMENRRV